ncbi:coiled-coil domain-containing protein 110 [Rhineura floridana]|uniref:coiled-coil domain-containing protein 110 n=1 Tax=Rhineura floridana TaxID=261503 RepID=UPI002AC88047|nr:coiled-coil domain-containing protein 110 [Rhineura floridana]
MHIILPTEEQKIGEPCLVVCQRCLLAHDTCCGVIQQVKYRLVVDVGEEIYSESRVLSGLRQNPARIARGLQGRTKEPLRRGLAAGVASPLLASSLWRLDDLATPGTQECDQTCSPSCGSLGEEEKVLTSLQASASGSQDRKAADKSASGRDGQVQPQSPLKLLQQQLESFQALRQQTLQNVSMVQSEINEILNKNITDMKSLESNPDSLLLTSTPINVTMPRRYQEPLQFKKQLHLGNRSGASQCPETSFKTVFGNPAAAEHILDPILLKYKATENQAQTSKNKAILPLNNDPKLKNSANKVPPQSFVGLEAEEMTPSRKIKNHNEPKVFMAFHEEEEERLTESVSSFKHVQEEGKKTSKHELSYTFEFQNSPNVLSGKDNDSGYLSEQDLTEKGMSNEDLKSRGISELEDSDELHIAMVSSKEDNQSAAPTAYDSKLQLHFLAKGIKDQLLFPEHAEEKKINPQRQLFSTNQEFRKCQEFCDPGSDDYTKNVRWLQMSEKESEHVRKKVMNLEHENVDLRNQTKPLADIIQSLTEQNSKYQKQLKDLHDEKNCLQGRLVKSDGDCKECLKEVKRLVKKCKEVQQQKAALEEKQDQLYAQNQRMLREVNDLQKKDQKAQESLISITHTKGDLIVALQSLEKQVATLQEENKKYGGKICQLTDNKSLLEKELGEKQNEMQKLKENEKTALSDLETLLRVMQSLKDEKLNLDKTLQEALSTKEVLQKEFREAQSGRANAEEKLLIECKSTQIEIGVLKTNLSNMERECERLRTVVADMTEDNWILKKELHGSKQEASECKNKIRQLSEELLLMENEMRSTMNERDVLQFEARRLQRNNANLKDQITTLVNQQYKQRYNSGSQKQNNQSADPSEICEEISSYQHISLIHNSPESGKIAEIRKKLEEEELYTEKWHNTTKKLYSAFSVSCTTSVIRESGFPTAVRKKYSTLCSAT